MSETPAARQVAIAVAPNGGRRTKADHAAIPMSPAELARTAAECLEAGAGTPAVDGASAPEDTSSGGPGEAPVVEHVPIKKKGSRKR